MNGNAVDIRIRFYLVLWYGLLALAVLVLGYFLAASPFMLGLMVAGMAWVMLLPYHAQLSFYLAMTTFSSAFLLPMLPGRPYLWEFAALLAWSGVMIVFWLRRYPPEFPRIFRENWLLFAGSVGYCLVLLVTIRARGFGLRILGSGQMGGRLYVQQLICAIFPLLFIMVRTDERMITRLFVLQYVLSTTYLVSDFVFSYAPSSLQFILYFLEIPTDALSFEMQDFRFGIRRFQSLAYCGQATIWLFLVFYSLKDFFRRGWWALPVVLGVFGLSLLSGHRVMFILVGFTVAFINYAQRFYTMRNVFLAGGIALVVLVFVYGYTHHMPLAFQRSVSFLPGIQMDAQAEADAASTLYGRRVVIRAGLGMIPQFFWLGRGFAKYSDDYSSYWDYSGVMSHINQGVFYNGFVGLMVSTGVFGTFFMLIFLYAGTRQAWGIIQHLRRHGCEDDFTRICSIASGLWLANVLAFLFVHGDSEFAMKTFSLQAGVLLLCRTQLRKRLEETPVSA